jgi:hypothetical protein
MQSEKNLMGRSLAERVPSPLQEAWVIPYFHECDLGLTLSKPEAAIHSIGANRIILGMVLSYSFCSCPSVANCQSKRSHTDIATFINDVKALVDVCSDLMEDGLIIALLAKCLSSDSHVTKVFLR